MTAELPGGGQTRPTQRSLDSNPLGPSPTPKEWGAILFPLFHVRAQVEKGASSMLVSGGASGPWRTWLFLPQGLATLAHHLGSSALQKRCLPKASLSCQGLAGAVYWVRMYQAPVALSVLHVTLDNNPVEDVTPLVLMEMLGVVEFESRARVTQWVSGRA